MNVCEIKYERTVNGNIIKKTLLYGKPLLEQEVLPQELEHLVDSLISQKKRIVEQQKKMYYEKMKGRTHE